ncbi:hypothetical protein C9374_003837 [Naegleria lovaniensis]|uniref:Antistasin-like domain-containing protein n=1 Tax=Naegleria lovaniensis TaxID=51637 RepID=A0AA88KQC2_NAELO|nr:uncharacterized protein C9374_003837 [Naegleria lovaniensis]KAG2394073.1 hypothetical protein C9374_003837 [Naegleria lovaniensis]
MSTNQRLKLMVVATLVVVAMIIITNHCHALASSQRIHGCPLYKCSPCKYGFKRDRFGCQKGCECKPRRDCPQIYCLIGCKYGYKKDRYGCQQACDCNPAPSCPQIYCLVPCEYGYKKDRYGCQIACDCNEAPVSY